MNDISISKESLLLIKDIFLNRIIQLESKSKERIVFSKQCEIQKIKAKILIFIEKNAYAKFEIRVLEDNTENIENYKYALVVKNYKHEDKDRKSNMFIIAIDNTFEDAKFYQVALNGVTLSV
jgi:hypothetical protein